MSAQQPGLPASTQRHPEGRPSGEIIRLHRTRSSASTARRWLLDTVRGLLADTVIDDAVLVVSELVANSVEHTRSTEIVLAFRIDDRGLVVEVHDQGPGLPSAWPVPGFRGRSRGLMMVGKLSSTVSSRVGPGGGCVVEAVIPLAGGRGT